MVRYENDCCGCATEAYPCMGSSCPQRHVRHVHCDDCDADITNERYSYKGKDYCSDCILGVLIDEGVISYTEE